MLNLMYRLRLLLLTVSFGGLIAGQLSPAPRPLPLEQLLDNPLSPGSVALLTEHVADPRTVERLAAALRDPRPEVRAAAGRALYASGAGAGAGARALSAELESALARESDRSAAREIVRALLASGAGKAELALEAAERLGMGSTVGLLLASSERERALGYLERLRRMESFDALATFLAVSSRSSPEALAVLAPRALRDADLELWRAYLGVTLDRGERVSDGQIAYALAAPQEEVRLITLSFLLSVLTGGRRLSPIVAPVLEERMKERAPARDTEEAFLLELIARHRGAEPDENGLWIEGRHRGVPTLLSSPNRSLLSLMSRNERRALSSQIYEDRDTFDRWLDDRERVRPSFTETMPFARRPAHSGPLWSTVGGYPAGLVADLLRITGCRPDADADVDVDAVADADARADVRFSVDGRPIEIDIETEAETDSRKSGDGCGEAADALFRNYVLEPTVLSRTGNWERLHVFFSSEFLSCLAVSSAEMPSSWRDRRGPREPPERPKTTKRVAPKTRDVDVGAGSFAFVDVAAVVDVSGCVRNVRVTDPLDPDTDLDVVKAVSQWTIEPVLRQGAPVPVEISIRHWFGGR